MATTPMSRKKKPKQVSDHTKFNVLLHKLYNNKLYS
ncbi:unnamed protein product [Tuber melanosporum]|uniref:(Perigord truffle) hypothetical protein n=1 Tax=Tuber melanosporum (strain Mel28) TaxID=656061 RepID=D5G6Y4_TUBMM|nr:uncharacterized protein GSTUM_00002383001 [Tuber melanosporum]CAZ80277.1 unnamed protein product [Tuber melanosporum]